MDGPFGSVATLDVWGKELEPNFPIFLNNELALGAGFVFEDLEVNAVTAVLELYHDGIVDCDAVCFLFGHEGGLQDGVGVVMVGNHDVLIDAMRSNGEAPIVVGVELSHMFDIDVQFVRYDRGKDRNYRQAWWGSGDIGPGQSLSSGGAKALANFASSGL